ncbi:MAG: potassium channel protein [Planctomycetaceae bacterium]|nr:potassium channel protein [Planctomycetaceae bacterium]
MSPLIRRVRRGVVVVAVFIVLAVVGHRMVSGGSLLDSFYWTAITLATVGYSERPDASLTAMDKAFTIGTIATGTLTVGYAVSLLVQAAVEGELHKALGARRMTREIAQLNNHVIICGFGRMGENLAERLHRKEVAFVIVEREESRIAEAADEGYLHFQGNATDEETLAAVGVERARTLVVALHGDADNVFLTLTARNMNPDLHILARGELRGTDKKLMQAGANQVIMPAVIGAQQMADIIVKPDAARLLYGTGKQAAAAASQSIDADMEELQIPLGSPLIDQTIREAATRQTHAVLIVSIRRADGEVLFNPTADTHFAAGDNLVVIGESGDVREFRKKFGCASSQPKA